MHPSENLSAGNTTLAYYSSNAEQFVSGTLSVNFTATQDRFLRLLSPGSLILDFGCGSGRDSKYFLEKGFCVEATDGCAEFCRIASENANIEVKQMLFSELSEINKYDAVWACASVLHLPKDELEDVINKVCLSLKQNGVFYLSFKYGDYEGLRNGRYFTDFTEISFAEYIKTFPTLSVEELWISGDVRPGRENEKWLNLLIRKN